MCPLLLPNCFDPLTDVQVIWLISLNLPFVLKDPASTLNYTDKPTHKFWSHFLHRFCPWPELRFYRSTGSTVQIPWLYVFSDHLADLIKYPHLPDKYIQKNCATCSDNLNKPVPTTWHNYFFYSPPMPIGLYYIICTVVQCDLPPYRPDPIDIFICSETLAV